MPSRRVARQSCPLHTAGKRDEHLGGGMDEQVHVAEPAAASEGAGRVRRARKVKTLRRPRPPLHSQNPSMKPKTWYQVRCLYRLHPSSEKSKAWNQYSCSWAQPHPGQHALPKGPQAGRSRAPKCSSPHRPRQSAHKDGQPPRTCAEHHASPGWPGGRRPPRRPGQRKCAASSRQAVPRRQQPMGQHRANSKGHQGADCHQPVCAAVCGHQKGQEGHRRCQDRHRHPRQAHPARETAQKAKGRSSFRQCCDGGRDPL
mmetsp:Transcript_4361/g.12741  ORF Transcript_4361/g.12741 Transcript_4361/m.12741 type:complete len:257 (-) Transcript_4361:159-929(-)